MSRGLWLNLSSHLQRVYGTILGEDGASAILPDRFVQSYNADMTSTTETQAQRYHGLDGLRGFAMLLGIVLHGSLPYFSRMAGFESVWPADDDQSILLFLVFDFIHTWRMPTFFLMAGFFAHLVLDRRSTSVFILDRLKRIALPLALFGAVMAVIIPPIWVYGWYGVISLEVFRDVLKERQDLDSSGELVAHLWFLYYLLLMYAALIALRLLGSLRLARTSIRPAGRLPLGMYLGNAVYTHIPLLLILGAVLLLVLRAGDESKPIWPLNVADVLYGALFFFYGYGIYARRNLIDRLRESGTLAALWATAAVVYFIHLVLIGAIDEASKQGADKETIEFLWLIGTVFYGASAVLFSIGLVGLFERFLRSPRPWVRWVADSSYWIYIIHLPVVTLLTFYLAHLDRQGWLKHLTGFSWSAELKFLAACVVTGILGIVTYRYLVRYTPLGTLLNGKRTKVSS